MGKKDDSKLEDILGAMGTRGCAWMLKQSGGTAYARVELGIQRTLSLRKTLKECLCREISAHDDHVETPNHKRLRKALGRKVASSKKYVLGVIRDIYWIGRVG
ncbi:hypothetical protein PIB30_096882 [Stylosanthes scabra]|uniref:Uncharacterized protein n=1 Tax=Stylosanthes scabra TaxID=79078 RepID=A0ABU6UVK7_9FABA|nr:hypothetical protein [Stylosanthes scabra]